MNQLKIGNNIVDYKLRESKRAKRLIIKIKNGGVEVVVPVKTRKSRIEDFIYRNSSWIFKKLNEVKETHNKLNLKIPSNIADGERFLIMGEEFHVKIIKTNVKKIRIELGETLGILIPKDKILKEIDIALVLKKWLKSKLQNICNDILVVYEKKANIKAKKIIVKEHKSIWGSCTRLGTININWYLVFAPKNILEYVIAHEVCHLIHPNHSKDYWKLLENIFPQLGTCKSWLKNKENRLKLKLYGDLFKKNNKS